MGEVMVTLAREITSRRRRGSVLIYTVFAMGVFVGIVSLAVDWGRVALVRTELMTAANAAARAGAGKLVSAPGMSSYTTVSYAALNTANGSPVVLDPSADVVFGKWSEQSNTFTVNGTPTNAVRVTARRTTARSNAVQTTFAAILGRGTTDVSATATAALLTTPAPENVTNRSNPWLAGMPAGTAANGYDSAPNASPTLLISSGLVAGAVLQFEATGATSNQEGVERAYQPDGNLDWIINNYSGAEHGISNLKAPISSLIGVFLSDSQPNTTSPPAALDFTSATSRNFTSLSPQLKQPFFMGDAKQANGSLQNFVVPAGATRLYVGSMDGQQWSDNAGGFKVTVKNGMTIYRVVTVQ
jgi:Flp pilus assembly protein TadG